jgi:anaerobic magnesium-protoporphyrin IX monomethyl ester cyclase
MLADDIFTSVQKWVVEVCEAIAQRKTDMLWTSTNVIRVESADDELFAAMRKAGCYRVSFGFESGNAGVLKKFGIGGKATIEQGRVAVKKPRQQISTRVDFFFSDCGNPP